MGDWISVDKQPLPKDRDILAINKHGDYAIVSFALQYRGAYILSGWEGSCNCGDYQTFDDITHWQDLPEPPK